MAQANFTTTITSPDLTSDEISLSVLNSISTATQGGIQRTQVLALVGGTWDILADEDKFTTGARVFLHNPSVGSDTAANYVYVSMDGAAKHITLKPGDWAVVPWTASSNGTPADLKAYAGTSKNILEFGVFQ